MKAFVAMLLVVCGLVASAGLRFTGTEHGDNAIGSITSTPSNFTVAASFKRDPGGADVDWVAGVRLSTVLVMFNVLFHTTNAILCEYYFSGSYAVSVPMTVPTNEWHHIAATFQNSEIILYWDCVPKGTNSTALPAPTGLGTACSVQVGGIEWAGVVYSPIVGSVAEVGIWDRTLSPGEVKGLATGQSPLLLPQNLIFYDPMTSTNGFNRVRSPRMTWRSGVIPSVTNTHPKTYKP